MALAMSPSENTGSMPPEMMMALRAWEEGGRQGPNPLGEEGAITLGGGNAPPPPPPSEAGLDPSLLVGGEGAPAPTPEMGPVMPEGPTGQAGPEEWNPTPGALITDPDQSGLPMANPDQPLQEPPEFDMPDMPDMPDISKVIEYNPPEAPMADPMEPGGLEPEGPMPEFDTPEEKVPYVQQGTNAPHGREFTAPEAKPPNARPASTQRDPGTGTVTPMGGDDNLFKGVFGPNGSGMAGLKENWGSMDPDKKQGIFKAMIAMGGAMMQTPGNFGTGFGAGAQAGLGAFNDNQSEMFDQNMSEQEQARRNSTSSRVNRNADLEYDRKKAELDLAQADADDPNLTEKQKLEKRAEMLRLRREVDKLEAPPEDSRYDEDYVQYENAVSAMIAQILRQNLQDPSKATPDDRSKAEAEAREQVGKSYYGMKGKDAGQGVL